MAITRCTEFGVDVINIAEQWRITYKIYKTQKVYIAVHEPNTNGQTFTTFRSKLSAAKYICKLLKGVTNTLVDMKQIDLSDLSPEFQQQILDDDDVNILEHFAQLHPEFLPDFKSYKLRLKNYIIEYLLSGQKIYSEGLYYIAESSLIST